MNIRILIVRSSANVRSLLALAALAVAGQAPGAASAPDITISAGDRIYLADQSSNTVSVVDPSSNTFLGVIRLGLMTPGNLSPLYTGQLLVHGMGFSPDQRTLDVVSVGSNSVTFIDTATNVVKHVTYVGRSPHEAFYTSDGAEIWVTVRGEDYHSVLDAKTYRETRRIAVPNGSGMTIFSPDGKYAYVCSSFTPETVVIDRASHRIVGHVKRPSFSPDIAATPDGTQVWLTLKDIGKTQIFNARPPFETIATLDSGPITNHVNIVRNAKGQFAYVTVGGLNVVKVSTTAAKPELVATIPSGQAPQGMADNPGAVPSGSGLEGLEPLGAASVSDYLTLGVRDEKSVATTVTVNNQGLVDIVQAAVTGLDPGKPYMLAIASNRDGSGAIEALAGFKTNPAGAAIVSTIATLRAVLSAQNTTPTRRSKLFFRHGVCRRRGLHVQASRESRVVGRRRERMSDEIAKRVGFDRRCDRLQLPRLVANARREQLRTSLRKESIALV